MKYPEYINGIKQVQNPVHRLAIKVWYSDWFRMGVILFPTWLVIPLVVCIKFNLFAFLDREIFAALYLLGFSVGLCFNDYSNLRRIGLDEYHRPLIEKDGGSDHED